MLERFDRFTSAISSIHRFIQKIERDEMEKYGLKGAAAQYLLAMARYPEGITAATLCEICDRDKAAVSRILAELEEQGMVCRVSDTGKDYRVLLALTPEGQKAADHVDQKATVAVAMAGQGLTDQDRAVLYAALDRIHANIKNISQKGIPDEQGA